MTFVAVENGQLHYKKLGSGNRILLAFHGFGQDGSIFQSWHGLRDRFTIYAFDLFYHGASYRKNTLLSKKEWTAILRSFLSQEKIGRFSVYGFSLGGRFAIASAVAFHDRIDHFYVAGPDGIFLTQWFKLATNPLLRAVFKYLMHNAADLERWIRFGRNSRIVNKYVADFVRKELGSEANRQRVLVSWNNFKSLGFSKKMLFAHFSKSKFQKTILVGENDHIIKPNDILPIIKKMGEFRIITLPLKHHQLLYASAQYL